MHYAYLFEARGIQRFLFASGRLRDMLGGSELLDFVCAPNGYLNQTLEKLQLKAEVVRNAGAVFYLVFASQQDARRLQAAWRLACSHWLPGVEQVDALAEGASVREAISNGLKLLAVARNQMQPVLPVASPITERSQRTAAAAVSSDRDQELLDAATRVQRSFERTDVEASLTARFLNDTNLEWPNNFERDGGGVRFPLGERRLVGLVHADGNGLGQLLRLLNKACANASDSTYIELYRTFSNGVTKATLAAVQEACNQVLVGHAVNGVIPARPLVLGGDDLSMLVRADLALPFTQAFIKAFERHSAEAMSELCQAFEQQGLGADGQALPTRLTACAGVCFLKANQPFLAGYQLAEGLCSRAKSSVKKRYAGANPVPSAIAFHKVQSSVIEDAQQAFESDHCFGLGNSRIELALPVYGLDDDEQLPQLSALNELLALFEGDGNRLNSRPLRDLATLLANSSNLATAQQAYKRWHELAERNPATERTIAIFDRLMTQLVGGKLQHDLPLAAVAEDGSKGAPSCSALNDLLALLIINAEGRGATTAGENAA